MSLKVRYYTYLYACMALKRRPTLKRKEVAKLRIELVTVVMKTFFTATRSLGKLSTFFFKSACCMIARKS